MCRQKCEPEGLGVQCGGTCVCVCVCVNSITWGPSPSLGISGARGGYSLYIGWYGCAAVLTPFFDILGIELDLFGVLFLIHWHQNDLLGDPYRIRSFWPQIPFFPRSLWVQFSVASGTPPSVFGPSTPPPPPPPPGSGVREHPTLIPIWKGSAHGGPAMYKEMNIWSILVPGILSHNRYGLFGIYPLHCHNWILNIYKSTSPRRSDSP